MPSDWARDHLQVIRTLMERSALYRRTLAPMTLTAGAIGSAAGLVGWVWPVTSPRGFLLLWLGVALLAGAAALFLVRQQALRAREPFWSPPTRRVALAAAPALFAGVVFGLIALARADSANGEPLTGTFLLTGWLPCIWILLYGCAVHAAGFFMPRGIRLFGALLVVCACGLAAVGLPAEPSARWAHAVMGAVFGAGHLAYGLYLRFTEPREPVV